MKSPPQKLFLRGRFPHPGTKKYLCVIGSRHWTTYGRDAVRSLINGLSGYPITIVSGLAIGIDSIAHMAALEAGLHCVAFPGSSLDWDEIYPSEHADLARRIVAAGGALLSEWEPRYPTGKWAFPARNRLMAGLSHATLVIEAGKGSGSLMTAKHAELNHRDVFAVPGHIYAKQSYGTHMLIQNGAALVGSSRDILRELGFNIPRFSKHGNALLIPSSVSSDSAAVKILRTLSLENTEFSTLLEVVNVPIREFNAKLSLLELEGLIRIDGTLVSLIRETG